MNVFQVMINNFALKSKFFLKTKGRATNLKYLEIYAFNPGWNLLSQQQILFTGVSSPVFQYYFLVIDFLT